jgi:HlyD family type I secretion membrane fusion protein
MSDKSTNTIWKCNFPIALGVLAVSTLVGTLGVWGTQARIDGAVIALGAVQVESKTQVIQHQEGGVVSEILVKDGDTVSTGDVLVRLDATFLETELSMVETQLFELIARRARLTAEQDGLENIVMPTELSGIAEQNPDVKNLFYGQQKLFLARKKTMAAVFDQVAEQKTQMTQQIGGLEAELKALKAQLILVEDERADAQLLVKKGLKPKRELNALKREEVGMQGRIAQINAKIAVTRGQITELQLKKLQYAESRREEAIAQLRDFQTKEDNLIEKRLALKERLARLEIRTPVGGTVFNTTVHALNSVIRGADPIMYIVPQDQPLVVSARASAVDIDKIYPGQETVLRFSALDLKHVPDIHGTVARFSADALADEQSGETFYTVDIKPEPADLALLDGQAIVPGMPVEAYIQTGERSPLNYLVKPLADYFNKAFREG